MNGNVQNPMQDKIKESPLENSCIFVVQDLNFRY